MYAYLVHVRLGLGCPLQLLLASNGKSDGPVMSCYGVCIQITASLYELACIPYSAVGLSGRAARRNFGVTQAMLPRALVADGSGNTSVRVSTPGKAGCISTTEDAAHAHKLPKVSRLAILLLVRRNIRRNCTGTQQTVG